MFLCLIPMTVHCGNAWRHSSVWTSVHPIIFSGGALGVTATVSVKKAEDVLFASVRLSHVLRSKEVYGEAKIDENGELLVERVFENYLRRRGVVICSVVPEEDCVQIIASLPVVGRVRVYLNKDN